MRILIARVIIKDVPIVLLDEVTFLLDVQNENLIGTVIRYVTKAKLS